MIIIFAFLTACIIVLITLAAGIAWHNIRAIKTQRAYVRHPHARRWRHKPLIAVTTAGEDSTSHITTLRHHYRKLVDNSEGTIDTDFLLWLPAQMTLSPHDLTLAIKQFNDHAALRSLPLFPAIRTPQTLPDFFHAYSLIISAPLAEARAGLRVEPTHSFPYVVKQSVSAPSYHTWLYTICGWLIGMAALLAFLFSFHMAVIMQQPDLLAAYILSFGLWCVWAIGRYPALTLRARLRFMLLLPAALGYFLYRLMTVPVRFVVRRAPPIGVS